MDKVKLFLRAFASWFVFSSILFLCAGRLHYMQGWVYASTTFVTTFMSFMFIKSNRELMQKRSSLTKGTKSWDKLILLLSALVFMITIVLSGLDSGRFHWSPPLPLASYVAGVIMTLTGHRIFLDAQKQNKFFASSVSIQEGHTVADSGIYKRIRHPGYLGMTLSLLGVPLLTGSLWSIIPTVAAIILLMVRTHLEDKILRNELSGYAEYAMKTKYRLIPGVW